MLITNFATNHRLQGYASVDLTGRIELADGRSVTTAPVQPGDAGAERAFIGALSQDSRYRRFHFGLRELSPEASREMTEIDQHRHVAFVARAGGTASSAIVADARYVRQADTGDAEFAVAVADDWQGAGLGRELIELLMKHARSEGVSRMYGDVLWGNNAMIGLVRKLGGSFVRRPGDATVIRAQFAL